jgi:urea transporter
VLAEKVNAQNAQLVAANTQLAVALTKQQHTDAGLPPTELANRWLTLVPEAKPTVITGGIMVPESGAVATVQQLELVPVQQQQLVNAQKELTNEQSLLTASTGQVATLNEEVSGLKLEAVDQTKVCTAQVAEVKAAAAKSKRKWFVIGYVAGFLTRAALIR